MVNASVAIINIRINIMLFEQNISALDLDLSLDKVLRLASQFCEIPLNYSYSYPSLLTMRRNIGNATLKAAELIFFPELAKAIRELPSLDYDINLNVNSIQGLKDRGITNTINALIQLNALIEHDKKSKAILDAKVNNLIMLHGQTKTTPIYQGCKPYYSLKEQPECISIKTRTQQIQLSGVKYYFNLKSNRFQNMKKIYELSERDLFDAYLKKPDPLIGYSHHIKFIGGIINTPLLAFHIKQSYKHQGKRYFLDIHTNELYTRINEVHEQAQSYAKNNYHIAIIEELK